MVRFQSLVVIAYHSFVASLLGLVMGVVLSFLTFGVHRLALAVVPFYRLEYYPQLPLLGYMTVGVVLGALAGAVYALRTVK